MSLSRYIWVQANFQVAELGVTVSLLQGTGQFPNHTARIAVSLLTGTGQFPNHTARITVSLLTGTGQFPNHSARIIVSLHTGTGIFPSRTARITVSLLTGTGIFPSHASVHLHGFSIHHLLKLCTGPWNYVVGQLRQASARRIVGGR